MRSKVRHYPGTFTATRAASLLDNQILLPTDCMWLACRGELRPDSSLTIVFGILQATLRPLHVNTSGVCIAISLVLVWESRQECSAVILLCDSGVLSSESGLIPNSATAGKKQER